MTKPGSIELRNLGDEYRLSFPVPDRYQVERATLIVDFTHSNALVRSRSQLRVRINGVTVAQWHLGGNSFHRIEKLVIPPELLLNGYNELQFQTAQHYTNDQCEAPDSPELWLEINPVRSQLEFQYQLKPAFLSLARLSSLLDKKLPESTIQLLFPSRQLIEDEWNWGGLVTQGIALRLDYAPFRLQLGRLEVKEQKFPVNLNVSQGRDSIIIGDRVKLAPYLAEETLAKITGPYLGLFPAPDAPERFVLLISGKDAREVGQAVLAFSLLNFPLPDERETVIRSIQMDLVLPYQGYPALEPEGTYTFKQLGFNTAFRQGLNPPPMTLGFFLPPDLFAPEDSEIVLMLHLAYNAGMRRDSLIEVSVNGIFEQAVQLTEEGGGHYRDYRIAIPLRTFKPGLNRITFQPLLVPLVTGECLYLNSQPLHVTVFGDSKIQMPRASHYAKLPDFSLLAAAGFPYLNRAGGEGLGIQLLNRREDSVLAAWHLLAKLARVNRLPLPRSRIKFAPFFAVRDLILVGGHVDSLKGELFKYSPIGLGNPWYRWHYPHGKALSAGTVNPWWQSWLGHFLIEESSFPPALTRRYAVVEQSGGLGRHALGMAFPHPAAADRLVTAFVSNGDLYPAIQALTEPALWSQMKGDLIIWRQDSKTLFWQHLSKPFYVGNAGITPMVLYHFSRHPWYWVLAVLGAIVFFAWVTHVLLKRFKRRHKPDAEEIAP